MSALNPEIVQACRDRLRGNGAWNGQGLLPFLALTSRKDPERVWMEPLKELCERVVFSVEDGLEVVLSDEEAETLSGLVELSRTFQARLDK